MTMKMRTFKKSDLLFWYSWTVSKEQDNKRIQGFPEHYLLYRNEGYEVLPFINRYMKSRGLEKLKSFHLIEAVIREDLPKSVIGHRAIKTWLENNLQSQY
jgi:hypothetical protein